MLWHVILAVCCFLLVSGSVTRAAASSRISSDIKITPQATLTSDERDAISIAASRAFRHIHKARQEIRRKESKPALKNVQQALTLAKIIDNTVPELKVDATIKSGDVTYHDQDNVRQVLIPLYTEEDEFFDASSSRDKSAKRTTIKNQNTLSALPTRFEEASLFFDVREAKNLLEDAVSRLKKNDLKGADQALAGIQDAVVYVHDEVNLPLQRARKSLLEASKLTASERFNEAESYLHRAMGALESYEAEITGDAAKKTQSLINSIQALSGKIAQDKADAQNRISAFVKDLSSLL